MAEETQNPITPQEFAKKIKAKYPQYSNIDDVTLAKKMVEKYPEYSTQVDFAEKKNPNSTATTPKKSGELVQKDGSLGTPKMQTFEGFDKANLEKLKGQPQKLKQITLKPKEVVKNKEQKLDLPSPNNPLEVQKPFQISPKKESDISQNTIVANQAYDYAIKNYDEQKSKERLNDELNVYQFTDGIKEGLKGAFNTFIATPLNVINTTLGGNKDFKISEYKPLESELKTAKQELQQELGNKTPISQAQIQKRAEELFIKKDRIEQLSQLIDESLPSGYDREGVWKELKLDQLKSNDKLRSTIAGVEVFKTQIEEFEDYRKKLTKEEWQNGLSKEKIDQYNLLREKAIDAVDGLKYIQGNFDNYLKEAKTDNEKLELFKYNYDDFEKNATLLWNTTKNIVAGTTKILADTSTYASNKIGLANPLSELFSEMSSEELNNNEKQSGQFYRYKASNLNNWSDFGSLSAQLFSEQVPVLASIYLGGNLGIGAVSLSSGGQKINELEEQAKQPFGKIYSSGEKLVAGYLYAGAEFFPEKFGTARILKDLERTVSSASSASRKLFMDGFFKNTLNGIKKTTSNTFLEGGTEYITAEGQIAIDSELLGIIESDYEKNQKRSESFFSGSLMGGSMSAVGGVIGFGVAQSKLYSDRKDIKKVQDILANVDVINSEIENNKLLSESEKKELYSKMNEMNNEAFSIVEKNAMKGANLSVREKSFLLDINERQSSIKEKANEIKNSNYSKELKKSMLNDLKSEFETLEQNRNKTLNGEYNASMDSSIKNQPKQNAETQTTTTETKPKAEVPQQAEAEKVEKTKYRIAELNNELEQNRIRGEKGEISNRSNKEIKAEIAELESKLPKEEVVPTTSNQSEIELKNEGKAEVPTEKNVQERLNINNPFYKKVNDVLVKLGLIEKYNPETGTGDIIGGVAQPLSGKGGFAVGDMYFYPDGSISYVSARGTVQFDKNGNVISENTKEVDAQNRKNEIESIKESITNFEKTRDSEDFKYKEATETDVLGNRKKVKRLKTTEELNESTDKINTAINKAKSRLTELEKNQPQAKEQEKVAEVENLIEKEYQENTLEFIIDPKTDGEYLKSIKEKYGLDYFEVEKELEEKYKEDNKGKSFFQKLKDGFTDEDTYDVNSQFKNRLREAISEKIKKIKELESNNNQISKPTENVDSQEIVTEIPNSSQINKSNENGLFELLSDDNKELANQISDPKKKAKFIRGRAIQDSPTKANNYIERENAKIALKNPNATIEEKVSAKLNIAEDKPFNSTQVSDVLKDIKSIEEKNRQGLSFSEKRTLKYLEEVENEATPSQNIDVNGNVRPRVEPMEQVGIEEKPTTKIDPIEKVQSANDVKPTKGKTKITQEPTIEDISNFLNENFKPNETNNGTKETSPKKDTESGKITSNQIDLEDVATEENKQSEYKFSNSPSLKNAQAVDSSVLPITPKATENILKNEGNWDKAIIGDVKNLGNGWFEVGKTVKGESILYSPTTDKAVTIIDSENKGGRNDVYVNDFINNNPTILEKQQRKDKANSEVDKIADKIKQALPGIKDPNLKKQGFSQDELIDLVANAVKNLISAGIEIDEAIRQVSASIKERFNIDVNFDDVKAKLKKEPNRTFKREEGKSSVLKRIREGGNSAEINNIIDKIGLNYEGRKQEQVYADGVNFVKEVGIAEAYNAIKSGELKDSDTINVVYATILQEFSKMVENEISKVYDPQELNELMNELDDLHIKIYTEFKARTIDAGRGSAILNFIYNQDLKIRYSLSQQIENFKKVNNGVVPPEALAKMKELDKQYQEANKRIEELENLLKEAQEQKDFENIIEEEKRQPKLSKTKREKAEKIIKALDDFEKSILQNSYSDATLITPILIQGIRATKLAIKKGADIAEEIEKCIEGIKKELEKLGKNFDSEERFRNDLSKSLEGIDVETKQPKVTVDKNGKVRIPTEMIKDFISKGGTDLSEFAKQVKESIKDEFPDVSVRDIRESVANYGKKANKSRPQIIEDIQKLKSEERLRLEYEDLQNRISKEKNEAKKRTLSQTETRLKAQIKQLQNDLGITESERTNRSVNYTKKRIEILKEKIKNNDFAKKEVKPIVESKELRDAKIEKNRIQEEFDYLSYEQEIKNRTFGDKAKEFAKDIYDSQRVTLATGEMSFVGAQGGFYMVDATFSRKTLENLIKNFKGTTSKEWRVNPFGTALKMIKSAHSAESIMKMFSTMGTANNYLDFQRMLKEDINYDLYLKSGLRILGEDIKSQVKDDNFIGNNILMLLKIPIHLIDRIEKQELKKIKLSFAETEKKRITLQGVYEKFKTGKISDKNKKTATEIFSNANPLSTFERGNTVFMNMARIEMFNKYAYGLYASGKNPIDHLADFKKLASAINTITGSGNMSQTVTMALPVLNKLMFSARYFSASWNLTPPFSLYYLAKLGNYDGIEINSPSTWKNLKPTVAQKAFVKPMLKGFVAFYGMALATMAMINASIDDDDEMTEEEKKKKRAYIEYDPRSSNFMQVISGNARTDYFGPYRGNVVLLSKLITSQSKNEQGEIIENGGEYGSRTDFQIGTEYLAGKANPFPGMFIRYSQGKKEDVLNLETGKVEEKRMLFDKEVGIKYQLKNNIFPIFATTVRDVVNEDPILGASFYTTLALFGKQTSIYKDSDNFENKQAKLAKEYIIEKNKSLETITQETAQKAIKEAEGQVENLKEFIKVQKTNPSTPYYVSKDVRWTNKDLSIEEARKMIIEANEKIQEAKIKYNVK